MLEPCVSTTIFKPDGMESFPLPEAYRMIQAAGFHLIEFSRKHDRLSEQASLLEEDGPL